MAAITSVAPSLASPAGEAQIRRGEAGAAVAAGQAVALSGTPSSARFEARYILATSETTAIGIALKDAAAGEVVDVLISGLMGGYTGLTAGAQLSAVNGVAVTATDVRDRVALTQPVIADIHDTLDGLLDLWIEQSKTPA